MILARRAVLGVILACGMALGWPFPITHAGQSMRFGRSMPDTPIEQHFPALAPRVPSEFRASLLQIPLFGDENLVIQGTNIHPTIAATLRVTGRLWSDGERTLKPFEDLVPFAANGGTNTRFVVLERGALLTLRLAPTTAGIGNGDLWVRAILVRGLTGATTFMGTLLQGYPGLQQDLAWPGSPIQRLTDGPGAVRTIALTDLGDTMDVTVPAGRRWRIITGAWILNLGGSALAKHVIVQLFDSVPNTLYIGVSQPQQGVVSTGGYALMPGGMLTPPAGQNVYVIPWPPDLELGPGYRLQLITNPNEATDNFGFGSLLVREWYAP
jgi:hypothetical protein